MRLWQCAAGSVVIAGIPAASIWAMAGSLDLGRTLLAAAGFLVFWLASTCGVFYSIGGLTYPEEG